MPDEPSLKQRKSVLSTDRTTNLSVNAIDDSLNAISSRNRLSSIDLSSKTSGLCNVFWSFKLILPVTIVLLFIRTVYWRLHQELLCGSLCKLNQAQNELFSNFAKQAISMGVRDYSQIPELKCPVGILFFLTGVDFIAARFNLNVDEFKGWLAFGLFSLAIMTISYLMKRCRIPALFLLFFIFPFGFLLQGHALMYLLPEMLALNMFLVSLCTILTGFYRLSIAALVIALIFDLSTIVPIMPALSICFLKTLGTRKSLLWSCLGIGLVVTVSLPFWLANPSAFFKQAFNFSFEEADSAIHSKTWNPILWALEWFEREYDLPFITKEGLRTVASCPWTSVIIQTAVQILWINFRWLRADDGIYGLISKFVKSHRGYGIRPSPWTPRQTLTVIFESLLLSSLARFPSLAHPEAFNLGSMIISSYFCIALAYPIPMPALIGLITAISYPLGFLYRPFDLIDQGIQFHSNLPNSLHFLPMVLLPVSLLFILLVLKRDLGTFSTQRSNSTVQQLKSSQSFHSKDHHRRSLSRKNE